MKIFEVTLRNGNERKYVYCKLNNIQDLSSDVDFFNSYLDCKDNQNKITQKDGAVTYTFLMSAIKKYTNNK
jgi:hypothetical protein